MHETVNLKLFKQITIAPHKAAAEASKIGNLEERLVGWLLSVMDVRAKTLMHGRVVEVSSLSVSVFLILQLSIHLSIYLPKWMPTLRFLALFGPACVRNSSKLHVFGILTWKWASRRSTVPFFDIPICKSAAESTSKWMLRILKNLDLPPTHDSSDHQDYYILRLGDAPRFAPAMVVGVLGGIWHWCKFGTQKICKLWDPRLYFKKIRTDTHRTNVIKPQLACGRSSIALLTSEWWVHGRLFRGGRQKVGCSWQVMWNLNKASTNCTLKFPLGSIYFQDTTCIGLGGCTWKNSHCYEFQLTIPVIRQLLHFA